MIRVVIVGRMSQYECRAELAKQLDNGPPRLDGIKQLAISEATFEQFRVKQFGRGLHFTAPHVAKILYRRIRLSFVSVT
jgi:hypothetical protein